MSVEDAFKLAVDALGVNDSEVSGMVCQHLIDNELSGHPSHGLIRIPEYVNDVERGVVQPAHRPLVTRQGPTHSQIDGNSSFGTVTARHIAPVLLDHLNEAPIASVAVVHSHHLGRLAPIGRAICDAGMILLGFVNYAGWGQKVVPWPGLEGRMSTNPLLAAVPGRDGHFILDMTTSAVAEGKIRVAAARGEPVPEGWLATPDGTSTTDPEALYTIPPSASILPLGRDEGYKGYGLNLLVELLAGVLTGGGHVGQPAQQPGNAGFFIAVRPDLFGLTPGTVIEQVQQVFDHLRAPPNERVRIPGQSSSCHWTGGDSVRAEYVQVNRELYEQLVTLTRRSAKGLSTTTEVVLDGS